VPKSINWFLVNHDENSKPVPKERFKELWDDLPAERKKTHPFTNLDVFRLFKASRPRMHMYALF